LNNKSDLKKKSKKKREGTAMSNRTGIQDGAEADMQEGEYQSVARASTSAMSNRTGIEDGAEADRHEGGYQSVARASSAMFTAEDEHRFEQLREAATMSITFVDEDVRRFVERIPILEVDEKTRTVVNKETGQRVSYEMFMGQSMAFSVGRYRELVRKTPGYTLDEAEVNVREEMSGKNLTLAEFIELYENGSLQIPQQHGGYGQLKDDRNYEVNTEEPSA
jgi:hypothetical protein